MTTTDAAPKAPDSRGVAPEVQARARSERRTPDTVIAGMANSQRRRLVVPCLRPGLQRHKAVAVFAMTAITQEVIRHRAGRKVILHVAGETAAAAVRRVWIRH